MCEREATIIEEPHEACRDSPTEPATYRHQPLSRSLDEIRLLKLRKERHGPVHCEVKVFPLEQAPEYIALSYRWGPPSPSHDIFIGDQRLKIRDILNSCLLELREDVDTWLWIDQICIAQADTTERNHQVGMMSRIYSNATSVIIWLSDVPLAPPGEVDHYNDKDLDGLSAGTLFGNVYFTRLWIVQEILLAKSIKLRLNGKRSVGWRELFMLYHDANRTVELPEPSRIGFVGFARYARERHGERHGLMPQLEWPRCISSWSANMCEDPRDKAYAMMGMLTEEDRLTVDYNKSVVEVFLEVVNKCIHSRRPKYGRLPGMFILTLGSQMGIEPSLVRDLKHLIHEYLGESVHGAASPVRFQKSDHEEERDYWWYECNGERFCRPRPPSASSALLPKVIDREPSC